MILELLVALPFLGMLLLGGVPLRREHKLMLERGIDVPKELFSMRAPGQIGAWYDPRQQLALEIGKRELAEPEPKSWDNEYHALLVRQGAVMIETGVTIQKDGRVWDEYFLEECDCRDCQEAERRALRIDIRTRKMLG